jgi:drug/metabolite transporter (DMT)-like permease
MKKKGLAAILLCVFAWGFSFVSTKIAVVVFPPMSLGMLRFAIALVFLFFIKLKLAPAEKLVLKDIPGLFFAGLFGVFMYFFCENNGVLLVSASEASIALSSIPALLMLVEMIAAKIKKEPSSSRPLQWIGCFISIAGVWLVAGVSFRISGSVTGYIFMTGSAVSWVFYSFLTRPLFKNHSGIYIVFWQSVAGFICFIPFSIAEFPQWGSADAGVMAHLLFLAVICSAAGYWCYVTAMESLGVSVCGIFINLIPVVTVIAGFFVLGDRLTFLQWCGAALVIAGVYLAMLKGKEKEIRSP